MNQDGTVEVNASNEDSASNLTPQQGNLAEERAAKTTAFPPDLQLIINSWASLPDAIRAGILAIITTTTKPPAAGEQSNSSEVQDA